MIDKITEIILSIRPDLVDNLRGLISDGAMDSVDIVFLVSRLSKSFGITIETSDITADNLDSPENIMKFVMAKTD